MNDEKGQKIPIGISAKSARPFSAGVFDSLEENAEQPANNADSRHI